MRKASKLLIVTDSNSVRVQEEKIGHLRTRSERYRGVRLEIGRWYQNGIMRDGGSFSFDLRSDCGGTDGSYLG